MNAINYDAFFFDYFKFVVIIISRSRLVCNYIWLKLNEVRNVHFSDLEQSARCFILGK